MRLIVWKLFPIAVVLLFALLAVWPLFQPGFIPTHDGEYHLIRFHEFETMLKNGYWFPRWAADLNSGYGVPLFNFNYPLPNYFGVFYHMLGFSLADAFKLTLATGYLTAIVFCFIWLSKLFPKWMAAAATIVFAFVPYWFVNIYIRGSVGEVLAISFLILALAAIERNWITVLAIAVGSMILSHNILALIFLPMIIAYLLITKSKYWWTIFIGLGISAYFWLPALTEQKYVVGLNTVNYQDYFASLAQLLVPSWGTSFFGAGNIANEMSVQIGIIPLVLILIGVIFAVKEKVQKNKHKLLFFLGISLISIFLMLKSSAIFWQIIPLMSFVQYPWRFLSIILPVSAFLAAYIFTKLKRFWLIWSITLLAVILVYSYSRPVVYIPRPDGYYLSRPNFTDGTNSLGNAFSTRWSPWKQARPTSRVEFVSGTGQITLVTLKPLDYELLVSANTQARIRVNVLYFPGWVALIDGRNQKIDYQRDGTITIPISPGDHKVKVSFSETPVRRIADFITVLSLFWLVSSAILKK